MTGLARVAALVGLGVCAAGCAEAPGTAPVEQPYYRSQLINAHFHSAFLEMDDAAYRRDVIEEMDAHGIAVSVLHLNEESDLADWVDTTPGRFLAGPSFPCWENVEGRRFSRFKYGIQGGRNYCE